MSLSGAEKLGLIRELKQVRGSILTQKGVNKLVLVKRLSEIRVLLSVKVEKAVALLIDPDNKTASMQSLTEYLKNGIDQLPEQLRRAEAATVMKIAQLLRNMPGLQVDDDAKNEFFNQSANLSRELGESGDGQDSAYEYFKAQGGGFDASSEKVKAIGDEIEKLRNESSMDSPEVVEQKNNIRDEYDNGRNRLSWLLGINKYNGHDDESIDKAATEYIELVEKTNALWDELCQLDRKKYEEKQKRIDILKDHISPEGELIINTLLSASPITMEQADTWANTQAIDKAAITRLKKMGYPEADVRRDMSEFYRISQGKLRNIAISSAGDKRANAGGIGSVEGSTVYLGSRFDKTTLWHELAHHLEADPAAKFASNGFLAKRREENKVYSLRSLTGNSGYGKGEGAYKDSWISHYIGKVYSDQTTEVWSMGVQYLSNPYDAAMLAAKDPEMAALIAGYLSTDLSPAMKAYQVLQDSHADTNKGARESLQDQYEDAVKRLAAGVNIVDDDWFAGLEEVDRENATKGKYYSIGDDVKFVGSWENFRVFSGKIRKFGTKRKAKGYGVVYNTKTGSLANNDSEGKYRSREYLSVCAFHDSIDEMKATMEVAKEKFDNNIDNAYRVLFYYNEGKEKMVKYANEIVGVPG